MSGDPDGDADDAGVTEQPYTLPGTEPAWELANLPNQPLTAAKASALIPKVIG